MKSLFKSVQTGRIVKDALFWVSIDFLRCACSLGIQFVTLCNFENHRFLHMPLVNQLVFPMGLVCTLLISGPQNGSKEIPLKVSKAQAGHLSSLQGRPEKLERGSQRLVCMQHFEDFLRGPPSTHHHRTRPCLCRWYFLGVVCEMSQPKGRAKKMHLPQFCTCDVSHRFCGRGASILWSAFWN